MKSLYYSEEGLVQVAISHEVIANEWDHMVTERAYEIDHGLDQTHNKIILPTICALTKKFSGHNIIDVGCGLGFITNKIHLMGYQIMGIDISHESIKFASKNFPNIQFLNTSITEHTKTNILYDTCIANMVLHNSPNLQDDLHAINHLLNRNGFLFVSIPHPALWYVSRQYANLIDFEYGKEKEIKIPFKVRKGKIHKSLFTYFHRTISTYINSLISAGFVIEELIEPYDNDATIKTDLLFIVSKKHESVKISQRHSDK